MHEIKALGKDYAGTDIFHALHICWPLVCLLLKCIHKEILMQIHTKHVRRYSCTSVDMMTKLSQLQIA